MGIDNISVEGEFAADASMRVGPRINFSVYKVPLSLDIAAKIIKNAQPYVPLNKSCFLF